MKGHDIITIGTFSAVAEALGCLAGGLPSDHLGDGRASDPGEEGETG
jgi:hypothetical protein